jgi:drug/metabolite transporter superfamily protein YnfA
MGPTTSISDASERCGDRVILVVSSKISADSCAPVAIQKESALVLLSSFWGWGIDGLPPDRYDLIGGTLCLVGVFFIMTTSEEN